MMNETKVFEVREAALLATGRDDECTETKVSEWPAAALDTIHHLLGTGQVQGWTAGEVQGLVLLIAPVMFTDDTVSNEEVLARAAFRRLAGCSFNDWISGRSRSKRSNP